MGDFSLLQEAEYSLLENAPQQLQLDRISDLKSKFILTSPDRPGVDRLLSSRIQTKCETVLSGPSLHILVPTLQCAHTCRYCQVSRSLEDTGYSMDIPVLEAACQTIMESSSAHLTVEFQGGDPLIRFDLVRHAIEYIENLNKGLKREIRFVIASTLHQLTEEMCAFLNEHNVFLSTSIDGPEELHNKNRPLPGRDSYQRTVAGINLARELVGAHSVSALMTTTRDSLSHPEAIVDEYVKLGLNEIFIRPLSLYGFAAHNAKSIGYESHEFRVFYVRALHRVLEWNKKGINLVEVAASIALNKILCSFDGGYVDLQKPPGAGRAVLVYNYDGYVYPSDEARMLVETGKPELRMGSIGTPLSELLQRPVLKYLMDGYLSQLDGCAECAFTPYCGPDPINTYSQMGDYNLPVQQTGYCQHHYWLFDQIFELISEADESLLDLMYRWSKPSRGELIA